MITAIKRLLGLPTADLPALIEKGATILDVRTAAEYHRWHIEGSVNITETELGHEIRRIKQLSMPVVACCRSGWRSALAARILRGLGVEAYNGGDCRRLAHRLGHAAPAPAGH